MESITELGFCGQSGPLMAMRVIGYVITFLKILIPIFIIVTGMISLTKVLLSENTDTKPFVKTFITKIVIGAFIFFIPTIFSAILDMVYGADKIINTNAACAKCMLDASNCDSKIKLAKDQELIIAESKREELLSKKEKALLEADAYQKEREKEYKEWQDNNPEDDNETGSGSGSYGRGCTSYVDSSSYNPTIASSILNKGKKKLGTSYVWGSWDCSAFTSWAYSDYVNTSTAAGLANQTKSKCVREGDVQPGDIFFTSRYDSSYNCTGCADTGRCDRWQCILHVGIVYEVQNGKVTKILHNGSGVAITNSNYGYAPNGKGSAWYIQFSRPYAN